PAHQSDFHHCRPVYEVLPGWRVPIDEVESFRALPAPARRYVEFVEAALGVRVTLIGTGAEREQVLARGELAAA
ncbi:MAG: adenylosuccinate synthase, partial [Thermoleophilia bacterium]